MASLNRCTFIGNLTRDPDMRYTAGGDAVCGLSIACNEVWKGRDGNKKEHVEFINVSVFGAQAEAVGKYMSKGKQIYVEGRQRTEKWQDKEGNDRYTTKILADKVMFLGQKGSGGNNKSASDESDEFEDGDIPF